MLDWFRNRSNDHIVGGGRVGCPVRQADIEVDHCASCGWLVEIRDGASAPLVRCEPPRPSLTAWLR